MVYSNFIKDNPVTIGPDDINMSDLHMNTSLYERQKEKVEMHFFNALASHKKTSYLAEKIKDQPILPT